VEVPASGRLIVNNRATPWSACAARLGLAQVRELGLEEMLEHPAKIRAFLDFVEAPLR
jgi:hypothetical protein